MTTKHLPTALAAANAATFTLTLCFTPLSTALGVPWVGYGWDDWHGFVIPHLAISGILLAFHGFRAAGRIADPTFRTVAGWAQPLTVGTYFLAMLQWPGGDDGGGMSWLLIMGPVTGAALVLGAMATIDRTGAKPGASTLARLAFSVGAAIGFAIWVAMPWLDILISPWAR